MPLNQKKPSRQLRDDILTAARSYNSNADHSAQSSERRASHFVAHLSGYLLDRDPELAAALWAVLQPEVAPPWSEGHEQSAMPA